MNQEIHTFSEEKTKENQDVDETTKLLLKRKVETENRFRGCKKMNFCGETYFYKRLNPLTLGVVGHLDWYHYYITVPLCVVLISTIVLITILALNILIPVLSTFLMLCFIILNPELIPVCLFFVSFLIFCPCIVHLCCFFCEIEPVAVFQDDGSYEEIKRLSLVEQEPSSKVWPSVFSEFFQMGRWFSRVANSYIFCKCLPFVCFVEFVMRVFAKGTTEELADGEGLLFYYWLVGLPELLCYPCSTLYKTISMSIRILSSKSEEEEYNPIVEYEDDEVDDLEYPQIQDKR